MVDQVGVERVVARHHHRERVAGASAGPAGLLPQRGAGAGEPGQQDRVESADVDAELERVGGGQAEQPTVDAARARARGAPRGGSRPGRPPPGPRGSRRPRASRRRAVTATVSAPRRDRMNARVRTRSTTRSVSRSATSLVAERRAGAPFSPAAGHERRLPQGQRGASAGRSVVGDGDDLEAGEPGRRDLGLGDGGRGQHEGGLGAVQRRHPTQPSHDLGDVGAEDAAVVVALVDHDVAQRAEEPRPAGVVGQQRAVQHVGVGEDVLAVVARPLAHLRGRVAVVGGAAQVGQATSRRRAASWSWASALVGER